MKRIKKALRRWLRKTAPMIYSLIQANRQL